jgi:hypothetical protein
MGRSNQRQSTSGSRKQFVYSGEITDWLAVTQPQGGVTWLSFQMLTSWATLAVLLAFALSSISG